MIKRIFDVEGPVFGFLDKLGQLIILSFLWFLGCLPIVTICTSSAALYYAVVKSVRHGRGNPVREFFRGYRNSLLRGIVLTLVFLFGFGLDEYLAVTIQGSVFPTGGLATILVFLLFAFFYVSPILSRFRVGVGKILKLSFVMSLQFAHYTFLFLVGAVVLGIVILCLFPMAAVLVPGVWSWATSFLMEKALRKYMPAKSPEDNDWYYEN